jgi:hypothetical protein
MRGPYFIFCWLIFVSSCFGQESTNYCSSLNFNYSNSDFSSFIESVKSGGGSDKKLVRSLFAKAHSKFLKTYKAYSQINDVFEKGNFDCLSGTYFLASSLNELGLKYKIFETNYHIFLLVETRSGEVLLESTDRVNGFISNRTLIKEKIASYQETKSSQNEMYLSKLRLFHEILPSQLPGLLYFNRAVETFNKNQLGECCFYLEQAWKIYDNPRIEAFAPILIRSIETSELDDASKEKFTLTLRMHLQSTAYPIASR